MLPLRSPFSSDYVTARDRFIAEARLSGSVGSYFLNAGDAHNGALLATDVAWLGPAEPSGILLVTSGTHGVEGYAGSAVQLCIAAELAAFGLDSSCAVVLVHALNPFGFAHDRRVNEDNVDINRNFVNFDRLPPCGAGYALLHPMLVPASWEGRARHDADAGISALVAEWGMPRFQQVICEGQYAFEDGLFFGGSGPSWSNGIWRTILAQLPSSAACIAHIDVHTGLGPYGYGEILSTLNDEDGNQELAASWYGDLGLRAHGTGTSSATKVVGTMNRALLALLPERQVCTVSLEFGTVEIGRMLDALRADNWLHLHGDLRSPLGQEIKRELRTCFCPTDRHWQDAVVARALAVFRRTYDRLEELVALA